MSFAILPFKKHTSEEVTDKIIAMLEIPDVKKYISAYQNDTSLMEAIEKLRMAVEGDVEVASQLLSDTRPMPFAQHITYGQMSAIVISTSRHTMKRLPASSAVAVSAIIILVTLLIGVLIMTQVKSTALEVANANNDTDAVDLIGSVYGTGKAGMVILALSVLVLGAVVILGYLKGLERGG
jgi:hypothetical protein